jgi:predicted nucleic acid-binding protein
VNVLVDTSMWSLAFRRKAKGLNKWERLLAGELGELIRDGRTRILGPIRQELLSGIRTDTQFERLRTTLAVFPDEPVSTADYEAAAKTANDCISKGIAVSVVDMLICAVAIERGMSNFTTDPDFPRYSRILPLQLHTISVKKTIPRQRKL